MYEYSSPRERLEKFFDNKESLRLSVQAPKSKKKDPYQFSALPEYLTFETWSHKEGLLLLAGVSPDGAVVNMGMIENSAGEDVKGASIHLAQILNVAENMFDYPRYDDCCNEIESLKSDRRLQEITGNDTEIIASIDNKIEKIQKLLDDENCQRNWDLCRERSVKLGKIYRQWSAANHPESRLPISYFLNWAKNKDIEVEWLDWAVENGYLDRPIKNSTGDAGPHQNKNVPNAYLDELDRKLKILVNTFPTWKESQVTVQTTGNLIEWIRNETGSNTREAEILKTALSEEFPELKKR